MSDPRRARTGHGRWAVIKSPCPGTLWTNDTDTVGFEAVPSDEVDATSINEQIEATVDHLGPAKAFDLIVSLIGMHEQSGQLDTWEAEEPRHRPDIRTEPSISRADIIRMSQQ